MYHRTCTMASDTDLSIIRSSTHRPCHLADDLRRIMGLDNVYVATLVTGELTPLQFIFTGMWYSHSEESEGQAAILRTNANMMALLTLGDKKQFSKTPINGFGHAGVVKDHNMITAFEADILPEYKTLLATIMAFSETVALNIQVSSLTSSLNPKYFKMPNDDHDGPPSKAMYWNFLVPNNAEAFLRYIATAFDTEPEIWARAQDPIGIVWIPGNKKEPLGITAKNKRD